MLYDECGCDDDTCAPNRVLESFELDVIRRSGPPEPPHFPEHCGDLWERGSTSARTAISPTASCWRRFPTSSPGGRSSTRRRRPVDAAVIDNITFRPILPSVQAIKEFLDCLLCEPGGGGGGGEGPPGKGIDAVDATFVPCTQPGSAAIDESGPLRTLVPRSRAAATARPAATALGLEADLTQIKALSWRHNKPSELAVIDMGPGQPHQLGVVIQFTEPVAGGRASTPTMSSRYCSHATERFERLRLTCRCAVDGER